MALMAIRHCVIHRIPKHLPGGATSPGPELSEVETELGERVEALLTERISNNLADAYAVAFDAASLSPVPEQIERFFADPDCLVDMSKILAMHLWGCQGAISPAG